MVNRSAACSVDSLSRQLRASSINDRYDPRIARREHLSQEQKRQKMQLTEIVRDSMIESGQMEKLKAYMRSQLSASGWRVEMLNRCRDVIKTNGKNISVEHLYLAVADGAKEKVPKPIQSEILKKIEQHTLQEMGQVHNNHVYHGN